MIMLTQGLGETYVIKGMLASFALSSGGLFEKKKCSNAC